MPILLILSSFALFIGLLVTWWLHNQYHLDIAVTPASLPPRAPSLPLISVIIPARNEERNIRRCVEALLAQDHPNFEVIVVDDRSSDATPRILAEIGARDRRLTTLPGVDLPPGWAGKPHALHQGIQAARGEWLCFVDADTFLVPGCLAATLQAAEAHHADLFTLMTRQELGSFWEKAILPLVFLALSVGFSPRRVNDPTKPDAVANGQFIFIRRAAYEAVGGYPAIRGNIVEDKALAERVKRSGQRLAVADGSALVSTRMYTSLPEMWEGWTKNIYLGLQDRVWLLLIGAFTGLLGALFLPFWLLGGLAWWLAAPGWPAAVILLEAAVLWAYLLFWRVRACRAFAISPLYSLTLPLGALVFTAMMFTSGFRVLSGRGVTWRGRTYQP
jgi:chlorobactene glucosyltransferase